MAKKAMHSAPPSRDTKRVFIVDDHPLFREGLSKVIGTDTGLSLCGEAGDAAKAFTEIGRMKPDLVITDINLPGKSGLDLVSDLRSALPELPVLVISMHDENLFAERVLRAGGRGYVMKQEGPKRMLEAIHKVLDGHVAVSDRMAADILDAVSRPGAHANSSGAAGISRLSNREFEVLRLIGQGKDSHDIADALHLSIKTVDTHRGNIRSKLGLKNSTEVIHFAVRWIGEQT